MPIRLPATRLDRFNSLRTAATLIEWCHLAQERRLLNTKWFAYRFLPPLEATMLFAEKYGEALRDYVATNVDIGLASSLAPTSLSSLTAGRELTQLWIARQRADEFPIPYELYLEFCFMFASRRARTVAPRPNQLRPTDKSSEAWFSELRMFLKDRASAALPGLTQVAQYDVRHFRKLPAQVDLRTYLMDELKVSGTRWWRLIEKWSLERRLYPVMGYRKLVDREVLRETLLELRRHYPSVSAPPPAAISDHDFWQSCFGVPGARDTNASPCNSCPQEASCARMASLLVSQVVALTGNEDPRRAARRENGRLRTARSRQKKAAGISTAGSSAAEGRPEETQPEVGV